MKSDKIKLRTKKKRNPSREQNKCQPVDHHDNIGFLLRQDTDAQQAKNQLRKASEDFYKNQQQNQMEHTWQDNKIQHPFEWSDNQQNRDGIKNSGHPKNSLEMFGDDKIKDRKSTSHNQLRAKNQIKLLRQYDSVEKNIFQKKQAFFNYRMKVSSQNQKYPDQKQQFFVTSKKDMIKTKSIGDIASQNYLKYVLDQPNSTKQQKFMSSKSTKYPVRALYVTPEIKVHSKTQQTTNEFDFNQKCRKSQFLSTIYLKIPEFKHKRANIKKNYSNHNDVNSQIIQNNKFYLHKTNTICILQKQYEEVNKYISLSNYTNPIHYEPLRKNRIVNTSELKRNKNKSKTLSSLNNSNVLTNSNLNRDQNTRLLFRANHTANQMIGDINTNGEMITNVNGYFMKEDQQRQKSYLDVQKQKKTNTLQSKTVVLRNQFQRLRKLLKKQTKSQFIIEKDAQMKIMKL